MSGRRRLLTDWKMACLLLAILGTALLTSLLVPRPQSYKFLGGREPFHSKLTEVFGSYGESTVYRLDSEFGLVSDHGYAELTRLGFQPLTPGDPISKSYRNSSGLTVTISRGRFEFNKQLRGWMPIFPSKGVTVFVWRAVPGNWLTKFRMALQRD